MKPFEVIINEKRLIEESENVINMPRTEDQANLTVQEAFEDAYKSVDWSDIMIMGYEKDTGKLYCYTSSLQKQAALWMMERMKALLFS